MKFEIRKSSHPNISGDPVPNLTCTESIIRRGRTFGVVVSDRKDGDGDEKEAREERPRVRAKGGRLRAD